MANFTHHTYTPKYVPNSYFNPLTVSQKLNPEIERDRDKVGNTSRNFKQEILSKPQMSSEIKMTITNKDLNKRPRVSTFEFYQGSREVREAKDREGGEKNDTPRMYQHKKSIEDGDLKDTRYFSNLALTKKANSDCEGVKNSKINQSIKDRLADKIDNEEARLNERPIMFDKTRKGSTNYPMPEITESNELLDHPNLKRFKSPIVSTLKQEFLKVMNQADDPQLYDRKTEKSARSKVDGDKVIMTRKELQIMKLKHKLAELEKQRAQEKLMWCQKEKSMSFTIHAMEKEIKDLRQQANNTNRSQQQDFDNINKKLKQEHQLKCRLAKELQNDNTLLMENLLSTQTIYNRIKIEQAQEIKLIMEQIAKAKQNHHSFPDHSLNHEINRLSRVRILNKSEQEQFQDIKKEIAFKQEYIEMLQGKVSQMQKETLQLRLGVKRLKLTQILLAENNQNVFKHCLRNLETQFQFVQQETSPNDERIT